MNKSRIIKLMEDYKPLPIDIGDEIYPNGIFNFSISRICEHIALGELKTEKEQINIKEWFKSHIRGSVNEEHLPSVDVSKPVIQVEIRPDRYEIIDGNHRIEKACRDGLEVIESFKLKGEQLLLYFAEELLKEIINDEQKVQIGEQSFNRFLYTYFGVTFSKTPFELEKLSGMLLLI